MDLYTRTIGDTGEEETTRPFIYDEVEVPSKFPFDGASAPRLVWSIIPPYKYTKKAACIHDFLCRNAKNKQERLYADKKWEKVLRETTEFSKLRIKLGYAGVRIGSWFGAGVHYDNWTDNFKKGL